MYRDFVFLNNVMLQPKLAPFHSMATVQQQVNLMFMVPCIIIYSYEITNRCSYMQSILFHC